MSLKCLILWFVMNTVCHGHATDVFSIEGNKMMKNGEWIVFNGVSFCCTEYMMKIGMGETWAYENCFGGPVSNDGAIELNNEPANIVNILVNNFETSPSITKVEFELPYNEIIENGSPKRHPLVRIPTTGSTYLYDQDCATGNHSDYVNTLDMIIEYLTNHSIAVSYDLHWSCPNPSALNCSGEGQTMMALKEFGPGNMGAVDYWDAVSKKYADNPYVFYELYNEPYFKDGTDQFEIYYNGNSEYAGMLEMYNVIRKNDPNSIIVLAGAQDYAFDASTQLAFWLKYYQDYGKYPTNVLFNYHPYQGMSQGTGKAVQGAMRMIVAGKMLAPVIFTEFGQYCCGNNIQNCNGKPPPTCNDHNTGDSFSYNIINMALQYDISWTAWAWWGSQPYDCNDLKKCNNLRNEDGSYVSNGTYGGAPWINIWKDFVNNSFPKVQDSQKDSTTINIAPNVHEDLGYLPRPCIMGNYNLGNHCGYDLDINVLTLNYTDFTQQSPYGLILPGLPPKGNCTLQGCPSLLCGLTSACK